MFTNLTEINDNIKNYNCTSSVTDVCNKFIELGYEVFATPTKYKLDNNLVGATSITEKGKFNYPKFDTYLEDINEHPFIGIAAYDDNRFYGVALMHFIEYSNIKLKDLFYSDTLKTIYTYATNPAKNEIVSTEFGTTKIAFSRNFNTGDGYTSTNQFSNNDGIWGFINGQEYNGADVKNLEAVPANKLNEADPDNITVEAKVFNAPSIWRHKINTYGLCDEDNNFFYWGDKYMLENNNDCIFYIFTKFVE